MTDEEEGVLRRDISALNREIGRAFRRQQWVLGILVIIFISSMGAGFRVMQDEMDHVIYVADAHEGKPYHEGVPVYVGKVKDILVKADAETKQRHQDDFTKLLEQMSTMNATLAVIADRSKKWE